MGAKTGWSGFGLSPTTEVPWWGISRFVPTCVGTKCFFGEINSALFQKVRGYSHLTPALQKTKKTQKRFFFPPKTKMLDESPAGTNIIFYLFCRF